MLKQGVQRNVFGHKTEAVTGDRKTLHNDELRDCIPYQILLG